MGEKSANFAGMMEQYIKEMERCYARRMPEPKESHEPELQPAESEPRPAADYLAAPAPEATAQPETPSTAPVPGTSPEEYTQRYGPGLPPGINGSNPLLKDILPTQDNLTGEGHLIVRTYVGDKTIPLEGSEVAVYKDISGKKELLSLQTTNEEGKTQELTIRTISEEATTVPSREMPYTTCFVNAWAPHYYPVVNREVDIFGGETSLVEIEMVPLPEERPGTSPEVRTSD